MLQLGGNMQTITFANSKGGAGKSTALMAIASALEARGQSTIIADLDDQGSLSTWLTVNDGKYPIPEKELIDIRQVYFSNNDDQNADKTYDALIEIEKESPDFLLIDTKGKAEKTNAIAMAAADRVICPTNGDSTEYDQIVFTFGNFKAALNAVAPEENPEEYFRVMFTKTGVAMGAEVHQARMALKNTFPWYYGLPQLTAFNAAHLNGTTLNGLLTKAITELEAKGRKTTKRDRDQVAKYQKAVNAADSFLTEILEDLEK
jgi:chromosome partitioning protein